MAITLIALGVIVLILVLVVIVQCILLSQMDKGHSTRVARERQERERLARRTAQAQDEMQAQRERAEDVMHTVIETRILRSDDV
jgi:hypothetical protein